MTLKNVPLAALVLDNKLHPRHVLDDNNVNHLVEVLKAGGELPPVVVDAKSNRVIDGFHRCRAYEKLDTEMTIPCDVRRFKSEAEMLETAIRLNAQHGLRLGAWDRSRCLLLAEQVGLTIEKVAAALTVQVDTLAKLEARKTALSPTGERIAIKRPLRPLAGQQLSEKQMEGNRFSSGMPLGYHVGQVISHITHDLPIAHDAIPELRRLIDVVQAYLDKAASKA